MKDTLSYLVQTLLQKHKINVDAEELDFQIKSHPSYPSLHAITGVLTHFNIENIALKIPIDEETLSQLPKCFLAQVKHNNQTNFALVINKGLQYKLIFNNKNNTTISLDSFLEQFTGIIVAVENDETKTIKASNSKIVKKTLLLSAFILLNILFFRSNPSLHVIFYFLLSIIGTGISYLIIMHDLGLDSKLMDSICSQESKTTNCNAVLNSKGATIFKNFKLSDVSLIYFVSISLSTLLLSLTKININPIFLISLIASPIVLYSLYYQLHVSKTWCLLCLGIVSVLVAQASIFFLNQDTLVLDYDNSLLIGFSFVSSSAIWLFINSKLKAEKEYKTLKIESTKFKRNFNLFNTLLNQKEALNTNISNHSEIVFGNKASNFNITIITNPFCGHCKAVHQLVEDLLKAYHNLVSITIRFNINTTDKDSAIVKITSRLLEIYQAEGEVKCLTAMHDIYENNNAEQWLLKWEDTISSKDYIATLEEESNWCKANQINFTPEILINGKSLPKEYNRSDLKLFIEDLNESCCSNNIEKTIAPVA